ncbi:ATP-binding protein [Kitasatospora sp. NPDC051984]|uniref:ATP-binding protein n=1 Tax=Kitasatospora sp. NPDC051984 TaxID=3364059 RepID=UPI0037C832DF
MIEQPPPVQPLGATWARWSVDVQQEDGVTRLRGYVRRKLTEWEYPEDAEQAFVVCLLVTELVGNALRHCKPILDMVDLLLWSSGGTVTVIVSDASPVGPTLTEAGDTDESGRGLALTVASSTACGWCRSRSGKSIWATVGPEPLTEAEHRLGELAAARAS